MKEEQDSNNKECPTKKAEYGVSLAIGIVLLVIAFLAYPYAVSISELDSNHDPQGFLVFTSENVKLNNEGYVMLIVQNLSWANKSSFVQMWVNIPVSLKQTNGSAYFVVQIPYEISNLKVQATSGDIENIGGNKTVITYFKVGQVEDSYILIEIPRTNVTGTMNFYMTFSWNNMLFRRAYSEYQLDVPFNAVFPSFIHDVGLPEETINGNGLLIFDFTYETLFKSKDQKQRE